MLDVQQTPTVSARLIMLSRCFRSVLRKLISTMIVSPITLPRPVLTIMVGLLDLEDGLVVRKESICLRA